MNQDNKKQFAQAFGTLCAVFGKETSPILNKAYFAALKNIDIGQVERAISKAITTLRFFPKPVELIELAGAGAIQIEDIALVQANEIIAHLQRSGASLNPDIDDPITRHLMTQRWPYHKWARQVKDSELKWWTKDFCEAYKALSTLKETIKLPEHIDKQVEALIDKTTRRMK